MLLHLLLTRAEDNKMRVTFYKLIARGIIL